MPLSRKLKPSFGEIAASSYRQHSRYKGCVTHWIMGENGGTAVRDIAGTHQDGTMTLMAPGSDWIRGSFGPALDFDGSDDHVIATTMGDFGSSLLNGAMTVSFWAKPGDTTVGIWAGTANTGSSMVIQLIVNADTELVANSGWLAAFIRGSDGGAQDFSADTAADTGINDGDWHHIAYVIDWNPGGIDFWVDGIEQGNDQNRTGTPATTANFDFAWAFGAYSNRATIANHYAGGMDDFRIYNRKLTPNEIMSFSKEPSLEFQRPRQAWMFVAAAAAFKLVNLARLK